MRKRPKVTIVRTAAHGWTGRTEAMAEYIVSYMVVYSDTVEADSPKEAADMVADDCPFDIDGGAFVTNQDTGETFDFT